MEDASFSTCSSSISASQFTYRRRWKDDIKMDLLGIGCEYLELITPAQDSYISQSVFSVQKYRLH
jgi:hypothetical protein